MSKKILQGKVLRDSNDKTIVVSVEMQKLNKLYKKYQKLTKKYHVHDENNTYKVGQNVLFKASKPISKLKKWIVVEQQA